MNCPQGGALDREARARGTTVYLTDERLDMLPERLSAGLASLLQVRAAALGPVLFRNMSDAGPTLCSQWVPSTPCLSMQGQVLLCERQW